ncbi:3-deoxy-D-manno-octulosonic acid transferase [Thermosulfuriphilus sp.]
MLLTFYRTITKIFYPPVAPLIPKRFKDIKALPLGPFDLWLQAVSVGEVAVAEALVRALKKASPSLRILLTSTTPAGLKRARENLAAVVKVAPYPLDAPQLVKVALRRVSPRLFVPIETELWPNMIFEARRHGARVILANARISPFSFPRYQKVRSLMKRLFKRFEAFLAISEVHAERLKALGAPGERIFICGNAKYEGLLEGRERCHLQHWRDLLRVGHREAVFVVGSLRRGEEEALAQVIKALQTSLPGLLTIVAPRHLDWLKRLKQAFEAWGLSAQRLSSLFSGHPRKAPVVIIDEIGHLFCLYGLAQVAFVGGSLVAKGGQNLLEPAAWGVPVLFGPHTENFEDARGLLEEKGGGRAISSPQELAQLVREIITNSSQTPSGKGALEAARAASGAASRQAELILKILQRT